MWRWVWIAVLLLLAVVSGAAWPGWLITFVAVALLFPPLWNRIEANGFESFARGRTFSAGLISALVLLAAWGAMRSQAVLAQSEQVRSENAELLGALEVPEKDRHWHYSSGADKMRGTRWWEASLYADGKAQVGFPYEGGTAARIVLSQSDDEGPFNQQPILIVENGQIDCFDCRLSFKFDDGPILESIGRRSDCGDAQCVNLNAFDGESFSPDDLSFAKHLTRARKVTVEVPLYRYGTYQYTFDLAGLHWPRPGAPADTPSVEGTGKRSV